mmetsp:Transcript_29569/g.90696  ORF Transcript_29569/g.90696 Transcript_29569/m.90696 type:complete len:281 (-) Transcript_29569:356-1198(-)
MGSGPQASHVCSGRFRRSHRWMLQVPLHNRCRKDGPCRQGHGQEEEEAQHVAARISRLPLIFQVYPQPCNSRDCLRHEHQHRRGDMEGEAQAGVSQPVCLFCLHGPILIGDWSCHAVCDDLRAFRPQQMGVGALGAHHAGGAPRHWRRLLRLHLSGRRDFAFGRSLGHHTALPRRRIWSRAKRAIEGCQVFALRPMQGDGLHSPRFRSQDEGQGGNRSGGSPPGKIWRLTHPTGAHFLLRFARRVDTLPCRVPRYHNWRMDRRRSLALATVQRQDGGANE